ncbi:MAG: AI-2E family transporter [Methylocystis sp.]
MPSLQPSQPVEDRPAYSSFEVPQAASWAIIGIFVLMLVATLSAARTLLMPVVAAGVLSFMLGPWASAMRRWGVPLGVFAAAVVFGALVITNAAVVQGSAIAVDWVGRAPELLASFNDKLQSAFGPAFSLERLQRTFALQNFDAAGALQSVMNFLSPTIGELIVFLAALFFSLSGREATRRYLIFTFEGKEERLRILRLLNSIERDLKSYIAVVAAINLTLALIVAVTAFAVGLPHPLLWGVVAFAFEFVPYVGPLVMYAALFLAGFTTFGAVSQALVAPLIMVVADTLEAYLVTPSVVGKRLTLNPGLIFLALVFWTWLWGPVGAILATPLLIAGTVTLSHLFPQREVALPE